MPFLGIFYSIKICVLKILTKFLFKLLRLWYATQFIFEGRCSLAEELGMSGPSNSGGVTVPGSFPAPVANFLLPWAKNVCGGGFKYVRGGIKDLRTMSGALGA
jgi:hypothetical protein